MHYIIPWSDGLEVLVMSPQLTVHITKPSNPSDHGIT